MATTFPLPTLGPVVNAQGISAPPFADIFQSLQSSFQIIYGTDAYIDPDSQDGQLLAIVAQAIHDANQAVIAAYNSFSPLTAVGAALSSNVKINGITRKVPTRSQVDVLIVGQVGVVITGGLVEDASGIRWALPASVTIPLSGEITVTATCQEEGAIEADAGDVNIIATPTLGWQTVTNPAAAVPGEPVELDGALRQRQALSTAVPSQTTLAGLLGAIRSLTGVQQAVVYENDTNVTDANGLPPHSISLVTLGGDAQEIGNTIYLKKTPGAGTFGTTDVTVTDATGLPSSVSYFQATQVPIAVRIEVTPRLGFVTPTIDSIKIAVADYINALGIAKRVDRGRLYLPAQQYGGGTFQTYEVELIQLSEVPDPPANADIELDFNAIAICSTDDIEVVVL